MSAPTLIRVWKDYKSDSLNEVVYWDNGHFMLASDHPISRRLWDSTDRQGYRITVYSTDELEWQLDSIRSVYGAGYSFICVPRLKILRKSLIPDNYLIEEWLAAEKEWERVATERDAQVERLASDLWQIFRDRNAFLLLGDDAAVPPSYIEDAKGLYESGWRKGEPV